MGIIKSMKDAPVKTLNGIGVTLEVYENKIVIKRNLITKLLEGFRGDKTINFKNISSIQLQKANPFISGYLQFSIAGGIESSAGVVDASRDEYTVMFSPSLNDLAEEIKDFIESRS